MKFDIELTDELIINNTGLGTIASILEKTNFKDLVNDPNLIKIQSPNGCTNYEALASYMAVLGTGNTEFERITENRDSEFIKSAFGFKENPAESTVRTRLDELGKEELGSVKNVIKATNIELLQNENVEFKKVLNKYVTIDLDVSPHDNSNTKKEGISYTYKGFVGYAPMYIYLDNYMLLNELRTGSAHSQCEGTIELFAESIDMAKQITDTPILARMDSGNESCESYGIFEEKNVKYLLKVNNHGEEGINFFYYAQKQYNEEKNPDIIYIKCRDGKEEYIFNSFVDIKMPINEEMVTKEVRFVVDITKRTTDKNGQFLLEPEYELKQYATNLSVEEASANDVIELYHAHATMEQYHSELKTDMDLERFPSGKFNTNAIVLYLAMLVFNMLRIIGVAYLEDDDNNNNGNNKQKSNKNKSRRSRVRLNTVIKDIILFASKLVSHARRRIIKVCSKNPLVNKFLYINQIC